MQVSRSVVHAVREKLHGRFLKKNKDGMWYDMGDDEAHAKVGRAFRTLGYEIKKKAEGAKPGGKRAKTDSTPRGKQAATQLMDLASAASLSGGAEGGTETNPVLQALLGALGNQAGGDKNGQELLAKYLMLGIEAANKAEKEEEVKEEADVEEKQVGVW